MHYIFSPKVFGVDLGCNLRRFVGMLIWSFITKTTGLCVKFQMLRIGKGTLLKITISL